MPHLRDRFSKFYSTVNSGVCGTSEVHLILYFMVNFKGKHGSLYCVMIIKFEL